jgi:hypothetical protein
MSTPTDRPDAQRFIARSITEKELSQWTLDLARLLGWKVARWPTWHSTGTDSGVPDLLLAREGVVLLVELKRETGKLSPAQEEWAQHAPVLVYKPSDWLSGEIERVLRHGVHAHCADEFHRCGDGGGPGEAHRYRGTG